MDIVYEIFQLGKDWYKHKLQASVGNLFQKYGRLQFKRYLSIIHINLKRMYKARDKKCGCKVKPKKADNV